MQLSVIIPARNEEDCIGACVASLAVQSGDGFLLGSEWELIVVNDGSSDCTREIAASFAGVTVIDAAELPSGWTGKNNACWAGTEASHGEWLLFTDADTIHEPGNLSRAMYEAKKYNASLLSYSPKQLLNGILQRMVMPLIFSELANVYRPKEVSDPNKRIAAANGQFLLIDRDTYFAVGGHKAIASHVLEDVELAWKVKSSRKKDADGFPEKRNRIVRFRYAADAVSVRMYRTFSQMVEGWTKNLALLFPQPLALVAWRLVDLALLIGLPPLTAGIYIFAFPVAWWKITLLTLLWLRTVVRVYARIAKSNFSAVNCAIAPLGIPIFSWLLWRSWTRKTFGKRVGWKGRSYAMKK
jgi:glycosyltransferase involved in cell wall biosynthesis